VTLETAALQPSRSQRPGRCGMDRRGRRMVRGATRRDGPMSAPDGARASIVVAGDAVEGCVPALLGRERRLRVVTAGTDAEIGTVRRPRTDQPGDGHRRHRQHGCQERSSQVSHRCPRICYSARPGASHVLPARKRSAPPGGRVAEGRSRPWDCIADALPIGKKGTLMDGSLLPGRGGHPPCSMM
jgi:hypothetical protein